MSQPPPIPSPPTPPTPPSSQFPPQPPPQYPPMPPGAPYGGYGMPQPSSKVSGLAITSLVCSLILCLPYISSLLGLVFGIAGVVVTAGGKRRGRPMAIIGIIISLLSMVVWTLLIANTWRQYGAPVMAGMQFVERAQLGDVAGARRYATAEVTDADIQELSKSLAPLGRFRGGRGNGGRGQQVSYTPMLITANVLGQFDNGMANIDVALVKGADGWKVSKFKILPVAPSTQPAGMIDFSDMATTLPAAP